MALLESHHVISPDSLSRRELFTILPAGAAGCLGCAWAAACSQQSSQLPVAHDWTENTDITWEQMFRFAYPEGFDPSVQGALSEKLGREEFVRILKEAGDAAVEKKAAGHRPRVRDLATLAASVKNMPPLMQHAMHAEIVEESPKVFEYQVKRCLWAKTFREENAADIGYAMICYPDYAVLRSINPKLKLIRAKPLMQGDDVCRLRYVMEG